MGEVKQQKGLVRTEVEEDDDDEDEGRVREWEEGLPSLADLTSLSQCLISPQLASAFSIASASPSPLRSSADVALASHAAFSSLRSAHHPYPDLPPASTAAQLRSPAADGHDNPRSEHLRSFAAIAAQERQYEETPSALHATNGIGGVSLRLCDSNSFPATDEQYQYGRGGDDPQENFASRDGELRSYGAAAGFQPAGAEAEADGDGGMCERNAEHDGGEGAARANARRHCTSEGSDVAPRMDADGEAEEAESMPSPAENVHGEASARTLKRPRLVWTPELRKRFVDAVTHLGVRTAVPKTIMQLMNVEGLTRENVASHLQKYRLYLKRVQQGLPGEGLTASDHLFSMTPLPPASGRFQPGVRADVNQAIIFGVGGCSSHDEDLIRYSS
ncbi:hypothetical protein GOP47_0018799 [Adiantum capillus-veneris]|uniref:HTH myb-type domain-containing protein n=1 Tax=Adiantum capillus-veneris TaxID=13818 RepID=A0A9D4Z9Z6_ADICA|nr:hypothetical protein GOP47_0018799 [Adiantum capillus-veneris]